MITEPLLHCCGQIYQEYSRPLSNEVVPLYGKSLSDKLSGREKAFPVLFDRSWQGLRGNKLDHHRAIDKLLAKLQDESSV